MNTLDANGGRGWPIRVLGHSEGVRSSCSWWGFCLILQGGRARIALSFDCGAYGGCREVTRMRHLSPSNLVTPRRMGDRGGYRIAMIATGQKT